jgi:hypothetical protein
VSLDRYPCHDCWRAWDAARPRLEVGFCRHVRVAWRVTARGRLVRMAMDFTEYRAALAAVEPRRQTAL